LHCPFASQICGPEQVPGSSAFRTEEHVPLTAPAQVWQVDAQLELQQ
jgi:hypothetical protein